MSKITESARGKDCTVMIPGVCNGNIETVVFSHLNGGKGLSMKNPDLFGCYACYACHLWLDSLYVKLSTKEKRDFEHMKAIIKTQRILLESGLITIS